MSTVNVHNRLVDAGLRSIGAAAQNLKGKQKYRFFQPGYAGVPQEQSNEASLSNFYSFNKLARSGATFAVTEAKGTTMEGGFQFPG